MSLSKAELERYSRHLIIPEFNIAGQQKLKKASVLVIGSGGLGSPLLLYLAAAGVGHLGIVDFDVVDESNLQRQVLFTVEDLGKPKVEVARKRLLALNPHINIQVYKQAFTAENAFKISEGYDIIADGTDNFPTRYLTNDLCVLTGKTNVYASIFRYEGQVSVFNHLEESGERGPNYRDLYPKPPPPGLVPSCAEGGVLGVLPGIIGSLQANEVIKIITGVGTPLSARLFLFDAASFTTRTLKIRKRPDVKIESLIDYNQFCGVVSPKQEKSIKEISVKELKSWMDSKKDFQLVDVRKTFEAEIASLGGDLIPLGQILDYQAQISLSKPVVFYCRSGMRSAQAITSLQENGKFDNLINLKGGILAWADEIDPHTVKY